MLNAGLSFEANEREVEELFKIFSSVTPPPDANITETKVMLVTLAAIFKAARGLLIQRRLQNYVFGFSRSGEADGAFAEAISLGVSSDSPWTKLIIQVECCIDMMDGLRTNI